MRKPLVSIVTTSYNQAEFLEETLLSVLDQDYEQLEYLVIDDGSTDESPAIVERYRPQLAWCKIQPNAGQVAALNEAFAHASGDILNFVNSDDTLLPGAVSRIVREFERRPEHVAVYGDVYLTNERSQQLEYGDAGDWDVASMTRRAYVPFQPATFWSRRAWEKAGPFKAGSWALFDVEFALRAALIGPAQHIREPIATFRLHSESKSMSRHLAMAEECVRFAEEFYGSALPAPLRPYARTGRASVYRRAALHYHAAGEISAARRLFLRSLLLSLRGAQRKQLMRLVRTLPPDAVRRAVSARRAA
jgi:glycosyltransferase involved in cell wall biosynthesis